ncbi:MAG: hypothetical protein ACYDH5_15320 [Acidimicrobiales bacterium]
MVGTGPFNVGEADQFRVPGYGHQRGLPDLGSVAQHSAGAPSSLGPPGDVPAT